MMTLGSGIMRSDGLEMPWGMDPGMHGSRDHGYGDHMYYILWGV